MKENLYTPNCIRTYTGKYFDPFNPDPSLIGIEDIAHALSMTPRFGGHLPVFYSVAQHCTEGAKLLVKKEALPFLLHDASEAYLVDLPSPIKDRLPEYKAVEKNLQRVINAKFGLPETLSEVGKLMDKRMLEMEWDSIFIGGDWTKQHSPYMAKMIFLQMFKDLTT